MRKIFIGWLLASVILMACSNSIDESDNVSTQPFKETKFLLGTVVTLKIYDEDKEAVLEEAFTLMEKLESNISTTIEGSEVTLINQNAGKKPTEVSKEVFELISSGYSYSEKASGSFDISIGPLTSLWHIGYEDAKKPNEEELAQVLSQIDYQKIQLDEENHTVYLTEENMQLDLGAIAKGFISDQINQLFEEKNVKTAIIDLGGNIYVRGNHPKDEVWTIGIQNPFEARGEIIAKVKGENLSVVTSGIYERYLEVDGEQYHHLLNPIDGYPFTNQIAGVTIISEKSMDGDALSTLVFSKGIKEGLQFINDIEAVDAIIISKDKEVFVTDDIESFEITNENFVKQEGEE